MPISVPYVVLVAKQREIEELKRLQKRSILVGTLGKLIHVLQSERGASSIFLASNGEQFESVVNDKRTESEVAETALRNVLEEEISNPAQTDTKVLSLIAWILFGLDSLPDLRQRISNFELTGFKSVTAYSRLIAGLISLIFEVVDTVTHPKISRLLAGLSYLVESKEFAGQERAIGALAFASGNCKDSIKQRIIYLIDQQERKCRFFMEFINQPLASKCYDLYSMPYVAQLNQLRQLLRTSTPDSELDKELGKTWFDTSSDRISYLWDIQCELVETLQQQCSDLVSNAESELLDSKGLLNALKTNDPVRAGAIDQFFDPNFPVEQALNFGVTEQSRSHKNKSVFELLQAQSQNLANVESELESVKRALNDRKVIERAKGILMAKYNLSEDEAHKKISKASMDKNLRLSEVAESILSVAELH